ncbi:MAG: 4Fe-4S binding protein [Rhodothermales bacterium]
MLFRRKKAKHDSASPSFPGVSLDLTGGTASMQVERWASDAAGIYPDSHDTDHELVHLLPEDALPRLTVREVENSWALAGLVAGFAASGLRAAAFTRGRALTDMHASLAAAAAKRLPFVIHHICPPFAHRDTPLHGDHDDYFSVADTGLFQLFACNVQEAADFPLLAHRIAELGLNPGLCSQDGRLTAQAEHTLRMPEPALIDAYLGRSDDLIECPTPAQEILFGPLRQRVPPLLDLDHPLGVGGTLDRQTAFLALTAQQSFFFDHLPNLIDQAMAEFGDLTGRYYERAAGYLLADAEYVVVAQGAVIEDLCAAADHLRKHQKIKAGVLNLTMLRPFPGDLVTTLLKGKKAVTVLERTHHPLAEDLPLLKDIRCAIDKAIENGVSGEQRPYPGHAVYERLQDRPRFFSGVYGKDDALPAPAALRAVFNNMLPNGAGKKQYYLGVQFDRPEIRLPKLERLQQRIRRGYPDLDRYTLATDEDTGTEPETATAPPLLEPEAPWTVREVTHHDGTVYDLGRFWDSVGYLHETGQKDKALADPFVATGLTPARSSAFRDLSAWRVMIPHLIAERCTACGACWAACPDSALPATIQDLASMVETALAMCEEAGQSMLQMQRAGKHLIKQAHKLAAKNDLHQYLTLGDLLEAAFARLMERMQPKEDQRSTLEEEFHHLRETVAAFPIVKSDTFFKTPEKAAKGSGTLFSMAVNPDACKACNLCAAICPEDALEMIEQSEEVLQNSRRNWQYLRHLPNVPDDRIQAFLSEDDPGSQVYRLLNRRAYHAMLGGDHTPPGNGVKTAIHLFVGTIEAAMQPRIQALSQRLADLIERTEKKIQTTIQGTLHINDFASFGEKLSTVEGQHVSPETLAQLMDADADTHQVDKASLKRLTDSLDALRKLLEYYRHAAHGDGRARMAMTMSTREDGGWHGTYPYNPFSHPWIHHLASDASAIAEGVFEGIMRKVADGFKTVRVAHLLLDDTYDPARHDDFFARFSWRDFTPEERAVCPPLVVLADDAAQIARLLRHPLPIKVLLVNAQRYRLDDALDEEKTHRLEQSDPGLWALAHRHVFVLQSTIGHPGHFMNGVLDGLAFPGPALFHVLAPVPENHGIQADEIVRHAQWAVRSRAFPLFRYHPNEAGELHAALTLDGNPDVPEDWAHRDASEANTNDVSSRRNITFADWAVGAGQFEGHFQVIPKKEQPPAMMPLSEFITLPPEDRADVTPFIEVTGAHQEALTVAVSPAMVALTEERCASWRRLLELAGIRSTLAQRYAEQARATMEQALTHEKKDLATAYEAQAAHQQQTHTRQHHEHLTQQLLALSGFGPGAGKADTPLRDFADHDPATGSEQ